jgi:hypothetical protein
MPYLESMNTTIKVNGQAVKVINSYSAGPGCVAREYDIQGGYVYEVAGAWKLQRPGQFAVEVTVER